MLKYIKKCTHCCGYLLVGLYLQMREYLWMALYYTPFAGKKLLQFIADENDRLLQILRDLKSKIDKLS